MSTGCFSAAKGVVGTWQVGIIDEELMKNLAICGAVILVVIFALVPNPRIAIWVPWWSSLGIGSMASLDTWWILA